jgi:hypothetical protein
VLEHVRREDDIHARVRERNPPSVVLLYGEVRWLVGRASGEIECGHFAPSGRQKACLISGSRAQFENVLSGLEPGKNRLELGPAEALKMCLRGCSREDLSVSSMRHWNLDVRCLLRAEYARPPATDALSAP